MDATEADWIEGCKAGRRRAFEPLVRRYGPRAYRFALGIVGDAEEAKDLSQEAFLRAYGAMARFDETRSFYPWFLTILRNVCLSYLRRRRPKIVLEDVPETQARPELAPELRLAMEKALASLKEADREILVMKAFQDMSYAEIAETLGIPRGTVMSRLYHARRRLKEVFKNVV